MDNHEPVDHLQQGLEENIHWQEQKPVCPVTLMKKSQSEVVSEGPKERERERERERRGKQRESSMGTGREGGERRVRHSREGHTVEADRVDK